MAEPVPIHTLVFDLDDTLYPEKDFVLSGFDAVDRWLKERRVPG
jgi:putative hydrolase of the HAD superfamily